MAASGLGSTVAALYIAFQRKVSPLPIVLGAIALGLGSIVVALSTSFGLSLLAMIIVGAGGIGMAVTANTTIQLSVPDHLRGRVMSLYTLLFMGTTPIGSVCESASVARRERSSPSKGKRRPMLSNANCQPKDSTSSESSCGTTISTAPYPTPERSDATRLGSISRKVHASVAIASEIPRRVATLVRFCCRNIRSGR
jgi:hypothetical protein